MNVPIHPVARESWHKAIERSDGAAIGVLVLVCPAGEHSAIVRPLAAAPGFDPALPVDPDGRLELACETCGFVGVVALASWDPEVTAVEL